LASRREDPDTLFFHRRLCIEGETETGLHVKNLLDALEYDWQAHFRDVFGEPLGSAVGRVASSLRSIMP
jgi:predicted lipid carrier protein YhbT